MAVRASNINNMAPSYIQLHKKGILAQRVRDAVSMLEECRLCPRKCGINRLEGENGFCRMGRWARVASYNAHFGEEPPLVGTNGSGTIFFSSCNLLCSFCQNFEISHLNKGFKAGPKQIAAMMIQLSDNGCHNINFVTPTHFIPQILEALEIAVENGLSIPLVYNSSGYDSRESLVLLEEIFDIYMPDFKFWDNNWSEQYCQVSDYREVACSAIIEMHRQVGDLVTDDRGIAEKGLLIRHLVMPEGVSGTEDIMRFIAENISQNSYINVMDQYRPCGSVYNDEFINRYLTKEEYMEALDSVHRAGLLRLDPRHRI